MGPDEDKAWKFVVNCFEKMKRAYKRNMALIQILERECYGENSFYCLQETSRYKEPMREEGEDLAIEL